MAVTAGWRHTLEIVGAPGLALSLLLFLTIRDPKSVSSLFSSLRYMSSGNISEPPPPRGMSLSALGDRIKACARVSRFRKVTLAAALNDIGFWALVAWQVRYS